VVALPPPTAAQVADALSGRYGPVDWRFRVERRTKANAFIDDISGAVRAIGNVELDNFRATKRSCTFEFDGDRLPADFNVDTDVVGLSAHVYVKPARQWAIMPLGLFVLDVIEERWVHGRRLLSAQGADLAMILIRSTRSRPFTVTAGTNVVSVIAQILAQHGLVAGMWVPNHLMHLDQTWPAGSTYWQIVYDLAWGINEHPPAPDRNGIFRMGDRVAPQHRTAAVEYAWDDEPKRISADDPFTLAVDRKQPNHMTLVRDDPRLGYAEGDWDMILERQNIYPGAVNSLAALAFGHTREILTSSAGNPVLMTTANPHNFTNDQPILIRDHANSSVQLNGAWHINVVSQYTFTIPREATALGSGGTAQSTIIQGQEWKGDSEPSTRGVINELMGAGILHYELRVAAAMARQSQLVTYLDPRRDLNELYAVRVQGVEDYASLFMVVGWSMELVHGGKMTHRLAWVVDVPRAYLIHHSGQDWEGLA
jgi:hypothetical protein